MRVFSIAGARIKLYIFSNFTPVIYKLYKPSNINTLIKRVLYIMMYLVEGEPLEWFTGAADHSVECKAAATRIRRAGRSCRLDSLSGPEFVEMLANFVYSETGDYYFAREVVGRLSQEYGCTPDLNPEVFPERHESAGDED